MVGHQAFDSQPVAMPYFAFRLRNTMVSIKLQPIDIYLPAHVSILIE